MGITLKIEMRKNVEDLSLPGTGEVVKGRAPRRRRKEKKAENKTESLKLNPDKEVRFYQLCEQLVPTATTEPFELAT